MKDNKFLLIYNLVKGGVPCPEYHVSDKGTFKEVQLKLSICILGIGADLHHQHMGTWFVQAM